MSNLEIRLATIDDLSDIELLENSCEHDVYSKDIIKNSLNNKNYYNIVIVENNKVIGYLSSMMVCDECELLKIVVDPYSRNNGIGSKLIEQLKTHCEENKITSIFLEVRKDNVAGIRLYEKERFEIIGIRSGYYNGVDAILYGCKLDDKKNQF